MVLITELKWKQKENINEGPKFQIQTINNNSFLVSIYLFATIKGNIHTDNQNITKMLLRNGAWRTKFYL